MKKIFLLTLFTTFSAFAQDANQLKEMSLQACESQVAQLTGDQKEAALKSCKCTIESTDYAAMIEAAQTGDMAKSQEIAMTAVKKCTEENAEK